MAAVAGSTVVVSRKNPAREEWPGSKIIEAFDATSGAVLWNDDQASFVTVLTTAVYTSVCHGGQNDRLGDCRLSARDPRTGATRWTVKTYASSSVTPNDEQPDRPYGDMTASPMPAYLTTMSYPTGEASVTLTSLDPGSGGKLGASIRGKRAIQTMGSLIEVDDAASKKAQGCKTTLVARSPRRGGEIWRSTFTTAAYDDKDRCKGFIYKAGDGWLAAADGTGRAAVVKLATGKTGWTAPEPGEPLLVNRDVLVIQNAQGGVTVYDQATHEARWRTGAISAYDSSAELHAFVLDRWLAVYDSGLSAYCRGSSCPTVSVFDTGSGALYRAPVGRLAAISNDMVITETEGRGRFGETSDYRAYVIK